MRASISVAKVLLTERVGVKLQQNTLLISTKNSKNSVLERIALQEKAGMFESVFGYNVILI